MRASTNSTFEGSFPVTLLGSVASKANEAQIVIRGNSPSVFIGLRFKPKALVKGMSRKIVEHAEFSLPFAVKIIRRANIRVKFGGLCLILFFNKSCSGLWWPNVLRARTRWQLGSPEFALMAEEIYKKRKIYL